MENRDRFKQDVQTLHTIHAWLESSGTMGWVIREVLERFDELADQRPFVEKLLKQVLNRKFSTPIRGLLAVAKSQLTSTKSRRKLRASPIFFLAGTFALHPSVFDEVISRTSGATLPDLVDTSYLNSLFLAARSSSDEHLARAAVAYAVLLRKNLAPGARAEDVLPAGEHEPSVEGHTPDTEDSQPGPLAPGPASERAAEAPPEASAHQTVVGEVLAPLNRLPPDDPLWDDLEPLLAEIRRVQASKQAQRLGLRLATEREAARQVALRLEGVQASHAATLGFLRRQLPALEDGFEPALVEAVESPLAELKRLCQRHEELKASLIEAQDEQEHEELTAQRKHVGEQIKSQLDLLGGIVRRGNKQHERLAVEPATDDEDATLSLRVTPTPPPAAASDHAQAPTTRLQAPALPASRASAQGAEVVDRRVPVPAPAAEQPPSTQSVEAQRSPPPLVVQLAETTPQTTVQEKAEQGVPADVAEDREGQRPAATREEPPASGGSVSEESAGMQEEPTSRPPSAVFGVEPATGSGLVENEQGRRVFARLREGDLAGAYWYAWALEEMGERPPVPSALLAVLQASRWLDVERISLTHSIIERVTQVVVGESRTLKVLATAAAMVPTLTMPSTNLFGWLEQGVSRGVDGVTRAIMGFASRGQALSSMVLERALDAGRVEAGSRQAREQAARLLKEGPQRATSYQPATKLWQVVFHEKFRPLLEAASSNDVDAVEAAERLCHELSSRRDVEHLIHHFDRQLRPGWGKAISEPALGWLHQMISAVRLVLEEWLHTVQLQRQQEAMGWLVEEVLRLQQAVKVALPEAELEARERMGSASRETAACGVALLGSLKSLRNLLRLRGDELGVPETPASFWQLTTQQPIVDLGHALSTRLLWCPPVRIGTDGGREGAEQLLQALDRPLMTDTDAFQGWLTAEGFERAERLTQVLGEEARKDMEGARARARHRLERELSEMKSRVEQGVVDGYVGDERARLLQVLEEVSPRDLQDYADSRRKIEQVKTLLEQQRQARLEQAWARWEALRATARDQSSNVLLLDRWEASLRESLERKDVRVLDERLAQFGEKLTLGGTIEDVPVAPRAGREVFSDFLRFKTGVEAGGLPPGGVLLERLKRKEQPLPGVQVAEAERPRVEEALSAWYWLKRSGAASGREGAEGWLDQILRFLGYNAAGGRVVLEPEDAGTGWSLLRAKMIDGGVCPVPQFGSQAGRELSLVCLWPERPVAEVLGGIVAKRSRTNRPLLVFYLDPMQAHQRAALRLVGAKYNASLLCLDEILLCFLAGETDERLQAFYACALPYAYLNPYTPFQAGEVPPEMYFGREGMVRELQASEGGCIVYGGRQLGKSALLREVCRQFHHPEQQHYSVVIDIRTLGDAAAGRDTAALWLLVRDSLQELGLLTTRKTRQEDIITAIRDALRENASARLLVLLDEADNLLDADAKDGFKVIDGMRLLMADTRRRFKVVLTGLHNVQRFQQLPNQPLAHFGKAIQVGPLEPRAAEELVRKPLGVLGFVFESDDDLLRILSYTNYHPGLIQLFCKELLDHMRMHAAADMLPVRITRSHVDRVYENRTLRQNIRDRFTWTLALDPRYQAIAWSLIVEQSHRQGGQGASKAAELLALARSWWPKGFASVNHDEFAGLVDEMCGLGVLVGSAESGFRLRSPNVVQLMGDVETNLIELSMKEPPSGFDVDRLHRMITPQLFSPLTLGQERQVLARRWAPVLVFGSQALGTGTLLPAFEGLINDHTRGQVHVSAFAGPPNAAALEAWLREQAQRASEGLFVGVCHAPDEAPVARALLDAARRFCQQRTTSTNLHGRILFVFEPRATERWLAQDDRTEAEATADVVLRKWSRAALKARLNNRHLLESDEHTRNVHRVTGGWGQLVERAFGFPEGKGILQDLYDRQVRALDEALSSNPEERQQFFSALGLDVHPKARAMLTLMGDLYPDNDVDEAEVMGLFPGELGPVSPQEFSRLLELLVRIGLIERRSEPRPAASPSDVPLRSVLRADPLVLRLLAM